MADQDASDAPTSGTRTWQRVGAWLLIGWSLLSPTGIVWAGPVADAAVAGRTPTVTTTASGQALVNIAAPNAAGISYNRYQRFDVDSGGLLLNNSKAPISTALGTQIAANPNLNVRSASVILNEVVSALPSNLNGPLSILGDSAKLIIANPNGITCNGCAFVNTSHVTLTTGTPKLLDAANGNLSAFETAAALAFEVRGGRIEITGAGLASGLDRLDLIAQTLKIAGPVDVGTGTLNLIAGRQTVDHDTLTRIANITGNDQASIGETLAIDASLLGAMNAGTIRLIATAAGMGVRSATNLAASSGDLTISASGDLTLQRADAARNISIASTGTLTHTGMLAGNDLTLSAQQLDNRNQTLAAYGNTTVTAPNLDNRGGQILAGRSLDVSIPGGTFNLSDGTLMGGADTTVRAGSLTNTGSFTHAAALQLIADTTITNSGSLLVGSNLTLSAGTRIDNTGTLGAVGTLTVTADTLANTGHMQSDGAFNLQLASLSNSVSGILAGGDGSQLAVTGAVINDGSMASTGSLSLQAATLTQNGSIETLGNLTLQAIRIANTGTILSHGDLAVTTGDFTNNAHIEAENDAQFTLSGVANNAGGTLLAGRDLTLDTGVTGNFGGTVAAGRDLILNLLNYTHGANETIFLAGQDFRLTANNLVNQDTFETTRNLSLNVAGTLTNRGLILAGQDIAITATSLVNDAGTVEATRDLTVSADSVTNGGGTTNTTYVAYSLAGYVANVLQYVSNPVLQQKLFNEISPDWVDKNSRTTLINRTAMYLDSGTSVQHIDLVINSMGTPGTLSAGRNLAATVTGTLANNGSLITAGQNLSIQANQFDNTAGLNRYYGYIYAGGGYHFLGAFGSASAVTQAVGSVTVTAPSQSNTGTIQGSSIYLGGSAIANGLTDPHYQTPANTVPNQTINLAPGVAGASNSGNLPGATWTPHGATVFSSTSRLNLISLPAGSLNNLLPASLQNTGSPFLLNARLEQQAIREAALKETGQASFLGMNDPEGERARLYDNAARFATANSIRLGTALSAEQIARLDAPILWYETQTVTGPDGQTIEALVPKIYLPDSSRADLAQLNGGLIKAEHLTIEADSVRNTGYISADTLDLDAETLTNEKRSAEWGHYTENVKGGYLEVWGDRVQPGGFISAAHLNLNADRIDSISGEFFENGQDASPALKALLGDNFVQTTNIDHTHSEMHAKSDGGLLQVVVMVVAVVVAIYTAGATSALIAGAAESSAAATAVAAGATASEAAAIGLAAGQAALASWTTAAISAGVAGIASSATTQLLTTGSINGGQLLKAGATAALTAGILNAPVLEGGQSINQLAGIKDVAGTGAKLANFNLDAIGSNLEGIALRGVVTAGVNSAINGSSFGTAFKNSAISDLAAVGANAVGQNTEVLSVENVASHTVLGAVAAKLSGNDAVAGGIGGATAALLNPALDPYTSQTDDTDRTVQHVAATMLTSGAIANVFGRDGKTAANAAQNETLNNFLTQENIQQKYARLNQARTADERNAVTKDYIATSKDNTNKALDTVDKSVMTQAQLVTERDKLQSLINGPTACAANSACRAEAQNSMAEIDGILRSAKAGEVLEPYSIVAQGMLALAGGAELLALKYGVQAGLRTSATISAEKAQAFLVNNGMSVSRAADFVASFDGPITARLVRSGEDFVRYTDVATSKGSFLTKTIFDNPPAAIDGLYLAPYGNGASLMQPVTSTGRSIVLEGAVANGKVGVRQSVIVNRDAFYFGTGKGY
ncbi:MAG TPA: filamentous hemagglutinin N-terminal domain-containing protein [Azonexus sp.]|nr:filamentous hemagglutinin N-terminal domain-containing protein [Azonexus sp.]